jgi:hypothetical protein
VQARAGMIRIDANSLKNQQLAIDACIILKPSAVTVTASRPRESSDVPPISKEISFNAFYRSAESWLSDIKRSAINPFIYFNVHSIDSSASDELKNPRAALTLPGGDLIVAIVKHDQNPNSTHLTIPVVVHYDRCGQNHSWGLPCLPSNDYYQWPATIIFVFVYFYHNILINVKKKYYILYIHRLIGNLKALKSKFNCQIMRTY